MNITLRSVQLTLSLIVLSIVLSVSSCSSDESEKAEEDIFWNGAQLNDFPLLEVDYITINITHPVISNNTEIAHGKIEITIPHAHQSLFLSLKQFNPDNSRYTISPGIGDKKDFSPGAVTYTISSTTSPSKTLHYDVTVKHGGEPYFYNAKITGFKFEKSKNPQLDATINAIKIAEYENSTENAIYIIVPDGTDFNNLMPTITFDAAKLFYSTDAQFLPYTDDLLIDFTYPKRLYLQAENSAGTRSKTYYVIVDVANPIKFDSPIITPHVKAGDGLAVENFFAIATWTNQGNHPITGMPPLEYKDKTYPIPDYPGALNIITASLVNPNGGVSGVLPGQQGQINVNVKRSPVTGPYSTTAVFKPTFSFDTRTISYWPEDDRVEDIFNQPEVVIQSAIVE